MSQEQTAQDGIQIEEEGSYLIIYKQNQKIASILCNPMFISGISKLLSESINFEKKLEVCEGAVRTSLHSMLQLWNHINTEFRYKNQTIYGIWGLVEFVANYIKKELGNDKLAEELAYLWAWHKAIQFIERFGRAKKLNEKEVEKFLDVILYDPDFK